MPRYLRAHSLEQASALLRSDPDACVLAGGQTLLPALRQGRVCPSLLIDLQDLGWDQITVEAERIVHLGALCRHDQVATNRDVRGLLPGMAMLAAQIGDRQVRHLGTLGGALAQAERGSCYPAALLGLDATVHTNHRAIAAGDFFASDAPTALNPGEIIERVSVPVVRQSAWQKFRHPASRLALVGVFVARSEAGVCVGVTGAAQRPFRARELEAALMANWSPGAARATVLDPGPLRTDLYSSAAHRAALVSELCARAVEMASVGY